MPRSRKPLYAAVTLLVFAGAFWFRGSSPQPMIFGAGIMLWLYFNTDS